MKLSTNDRKRTGRRGLGLLAWPLVLVACGDSGGSGESGTASDSRTGTETTAAEAEDSTSVPTTSDSGSATDSEGVPTTGMSGDGDESSTGMSACGASPDDCPASACQTSSCVAGRCMYDDLPDGTETSEQTPGDCAVLVCDGAGEVRQDADPDDIFDDGVACTVDSCEGLTPVNTPQTMPCYTGMDGTQDVGQCVGGTRTCDPAMGDFGACEGEVVPAIEDCDALHLDEDCDGAVDEDGPGCVCGDGILSAGEVCDDGDTVDDACAPACEAQQEVLDLSVGGSLCALLSGGVIKCWGPGGNGSLGYGDTLDRGDEPGEMGADLPAVDLGAGKTAIGISNGTQHSCAVLTGGGLKCWGGNIFGQLGLGIPVSQVGDDPNEMGDDLPPVDLGQGALVTSVALGREFSCAMLVGGAVKCWGNNGNGQLGLGDTANRGDQPNEMGDNLPFVDLGQGQTAVAVSTGRFHSCALLTGGAVKCWGIGGGGQLGLGDGANRGDQPNEMGDNLPFVDLGLGVTATAVSAGNEHSCALLSDGHVKCWGRNSFGQLGLGDTQHRGDNPNEMGDALPFVDLGMGQTATAVVAATRYSCALLVDGAVKCWGLNLSGELGLGFEGDPVGDGPGEMGDNLVSTDFGAVTAVGVHVYHHFNGPSRTCVRLADSSIKCWGTNDTGALGHETMEPLVGDDPGEMGDALPRSRLFSSVW